jgi:hypothetical protein
MTDPSNPTDIMFTGAGNPWVDVTGEPIDPATESAALLGASVPRWPAKADAYAAGWKNKFGAWPSKANVILGLAVAQHETACGDAWSGEHNWGACQKRTLNVQERAALSRAGITANPHNVAAARGTIAQAIANGSCPPLDHEALHVDSSPVTGWYFVYFWAFATDEGGATLFVHVLAEQRASCRLTLEGAQDATLVGDAYKLAATMYQTHYYEGVHNPHQPGGAQANINDYAQALQGLVPGIAVALSAWTPDGSVPAPPGPPTFDLSTVIGYQDALKYLAVKLGKPEFDPGLVDGIRGPKTLAAVRAFQAAFVPQDGDGIVGPQTKSAIQTELDKSSAA